MGSIAGSHSRRDMSEGLRRGDELLCAILWLEAPGCEPPNDSIGRVPSARRSADRWHHFGDRKNLMSPEGFVARYTMDPSVDGLPEGEATFLPCTFWMADNYLLQGRRKDAINTFERLLAI